MLKLRNILVIIGIFFVLKYIGQIMKAKNAAKQKEQDEKAKQKLQRQKEFVQKNAGKTFVIPKSTESHLNDIEDVEYEDVNN